MNRHDLLNLFLAGLCVSMLGFVMTTHRQNEQRNHALAVQPDPCMVRGYCRMVDRLHALNRKELK